MFTTWRRCTALLEVLGSPSPALALEDSTAAATERWPTWPTPVRRWLSPRRAWCAVTG